MTFTILTLFPDMITGGLNHSIFARAMAAGLIDLRAVNIRDFAGNKHGTVDDTPYGGGAGMVMAAPPVYRAWQSAHTASAHTVYLTPQGKPFTQAAAERLAAVGHLILLCGHYEGVDERAIDLIQPEEISLGDFILTGGELAAMAVIDSVARLIPGVLHNPGSPHDESFGHGLLEYPQYTKPYEYQGLTVPDVLLSGHHGRVADWRASMALERTKAKRPDLYDEYVKNLGVPPQTPLGTSPQTP